MRAVEERDGALRERTAGHDDDVLDLLRRDGANAHVEGHAVHVGMQTEVAEDYVEALPSYDPFERLLSARQHENVVLWRQGTSNDGAQLELVIDDENIG